MLEFRAERRAADLLQLFDLGAFRSLKADWVDLGFHKI